MADYPIVPDLGMAKSLALFFDLEWAVELRQIRRALQRIESGEEQSTDHEVWLITSRLALHAAMFPSHHGSEPQYDVRSQMQ